MLVTRNSFRSINMAWRLSVWAERIFALTSLSKDLRQSAVSTLSSYTLGMMVGIPCQAALHMLGGSRALMGIKGGNVDPEIITMNSTYHGHHRGKAKLISRIRDFMLYCVIGVGPKQNGIPDLELRKACLRLDANFAR
ncbi:MAG: hypothetical protein ACPG06_09680 [Alphaproteobacteria bacterium]